MRLMPRCFQISAFLLLILVQSIGQAQTTYLQPERIYAGDITQLVIEIDSKIPSLYALDTSVLKQDFDVLDIKSSVLRVLENNNLFHRMSWKIDLLPRRHGQLKIPSLMIGETATPELGLVVIPEPPESSANHRVFVEIEALPKNPYVGQQTQIVIRVIHNTPLSNTGLLLPASEHTDVFLAKSDSTYSIVRDGSSFDVFERQLAMIAQVPGDIEIPAASYRGIINAGDEAVTTDSTPPARTIYRKSDSLVLQVRKPASNFTGHNWLPARRLSVTRQWEDNKVGLQVGDTLDVTLTIEATGLAAESLPADLLAQNTDQIRVYADQATRSNRFEDQELIGRLQQRFAIVIAEAGVISLPATRLKWWNTDRESEETVVLEARQWTVSDSGTGKETAMDAASFQYQPGSDTVSPVLGAIYNHWRSYWPMIVLLSALLLLLASPLRLKIIAVVSAFTRQRRDRSLLKLACRSNNAAETRHQLLKWGRAYLPGVGIVGLHQIEAVLNNNDLSLELRRLDAVLYSNRISGWQGDRLWHLIEAERRRGRQAPGATNSMPDLYPQQV